MDTLLLERERLWNLHPVICGAAVLPTISVQNAVGALQHGARRTRFSHAFWADPCTGKSTCLEAIESYIRNQHPNSGVLCYEAMADERTAEGRLLEDILRQMELGGRIVHSLAGKRDQLTRALLALAGADMHLFILIDEAQELYLRELNWLKAVINKLVKKKVKVSTVLMGQRQLLDRVDELQKAGRKDLLERFFKRIIEFKGCCTLDDFATLCAAIDAKSEYPEGSKWTYSQFLFPLAYSEGFRLQSQATVLWEHLIERLGAAEVERGIAMEAIAVYLAQLCLLHKDHDVAGMELQGDLLVQAAKEAFR